MNKAEFASYLVSLHTLIEAQMKSAHSIPAPILAAEYERCWDQLKEKIKDETRQSADKHDDRNQGGTGIEGDLPRRG